MISSAQYKVTHGLDQRDCGTTANLHHQALYDANRLPELPW